MLHRLVLAAAAMFLLACALSSCNGGGGTTPVPDPGQETRIILASGGGAVFPAGAFTVATEVDVNEDLTGAQAGNAGFPADSGALLGTTTVKVPAGVTLNSDIMVYIALSPAQPTNLAFNIFMFNPTTSMWETTAGASSLNKGAAAMGMITNGNIASFTAPTAGATGFEATYGVFEKYAVDTGGGVIVPPNEIPTVSVEADDTSVDADVTVNLTATGSDPDGDALTFSWMAAGGTLGTASTTGGTSTNTWSAGDGGSYVVSVSVNDGNGGVATDAVVINVAGGGTPPPPNDAPVIADLAKNVANVYTTQEVHLSATVTDPNGDDLTVTWGGGGTFSHQEYDPATGAATASWTTDAAGSVTLTVTADDGVAGTSATADSELTFDVTALPTEFDWVGYTSCADACHSGFSDVTQEGWLATNHSSAWERNLLTSDHLSASCYRCHGVGIGPTGEGGFISYDTTPQFANIQCESCHGTGAGHPGNGALPKPWNPGTGYAKDAEGNYVIVDDVYQYDEEYDGSGGYGCGLCHEGGRHGSFEEWAESWHANFVNTEEDEDNPGTMIPNHKLTGGSCAKCHNGPEFVRVTIRGGDSGEVPEYTLDDLPDLYISCATCHDPHNNEFEAQLRVDSEADIVIPWDDEAINGGKGNICIACHNGRRTRGNYDDQMAEGSGHFGPHHNVQGPILFGLMGADLGNPPVAASYDYEHPHQTWNEDTCTTCHMYRRPYIDSENPQLWGHNFEPRFERCITCHGNFTDEAEFWLWVEEYQAEIEDMIQAFKDAWPAAWKDGEGEPVNVESNPGDGDGPPELDPVGNAYRAALWNLYLVEDDGTVGVHNPTYTKALLEDATAAVEALPDP